MRISGLNLSVCVCEQSPDSRRKMFLLGANRLRVVMRLRDGDARQHVYAATSRSTTTGRPGSCGGDEEPVAGRERAAKVNGTRAPIAQKRLTSNGRTRLDKG